MRALVVYESFYGNTESIADRIADGLARHVSVDAVRIEDVRPGEIAGLDLLVVGAPPPFRREWLEALPAGDGRPSAAFSTQWDRPHLLSGIGADAIESKLLALGWISLAPAQTFLVAGFDGPLRTGELDCADNWGRMLGRALHAPRGQVSLSG